MHRVAGFCRRHMDGLGTFRIPVTVPGRGPDAAAVACIIHYK
jgi:hypothetical protein